MEPVTILIPAYNEANAIVPTIQKVQETLRTAGLPGEIVVVDDGSSDGTGAAVAQLADESVRLIQHPQNKGYGASLKTGIRRAQYNNIIITDADGTYPIEMIPTLAAELQNYDMVVGARTGQTVEIPLSRRPAKWALTRLANYLSGMEIPDLNSGLRGFKKEIVVDYFRMLPSGFSFTTSITLAMLTNDYNVLYIPIDYFQRTGKSKIKPVRDTINFFSLVVRVVLMYRPLRVFVPLAAVLVLLSLIKVIYDINAYDFHLATSTVVLLTLTFQMIMLGLIADLVVSLHKSQR
ncbi:MAG: glycosyltransferase family 2 protein [Anaerolineae bacterium]|nr:glycosyltransferase family 2 protein [Anaerolineae bacterium]